MGLSGLVGAGAQAGLMDLLQQQLVEQQMAQRVREFEARQAQEQALLAMRQRELDSLDENRQFNQALQFEDRAQRQAAAQQTATAQQAEAGVRQNIAGVLQLPGLSPEQRQSEVLGASVRGGVSLDPAVRDAITPKPIKLREVTTLGPNGRPLNKMVPETEAVEEYERPLASAGPARTEMTPGQKFSATRALRNDFVRESEAAREVTTQLSLMRSSLEAANRGDLAAGSQGILVTFQKILDPTSVVRESEYARSASGQALLSRIEGAYDRLRQGGAGVPVAELAKFVTLAEQFARNQIAAAADAKAQVDTIATEYGIDPSLVTREIRVPEGTSPGAAAAEAAPAPPTPSSRYQDYLRRKKGGQ